MRKDKLRTIGYIFLHTVVTQVIVLSILALVCFLGYFGMLCYANIILAILGVISTMVMLVAFVSVEIFTKSYGLSIFAKTRKEFYGVRAQPSGITEIHYSFGPKNPLTGARSVSVSEKQQSAGCLSYLLLIIPALIKGATGIFKFIIESIRVVYSDARQNAWEEGRNFLNQKISEEGLFSFYKVPVICAAFFIIVSLIAFPAYAVDAYKYNPSCVEINIDQKGIMQNNRGEDFLVFEGTVKNTGVTGIEIVEGIARFRDKDGNLLKEHNVNVKAFYLDPSDEFLESDETWDVSFSMYISSDDPGVLFMCESELSEIDITLEIGYVKYADGKAVSFVNTFVPVTVE